MVLGQLTGIHIIECAVSVIGSCPGSILAEILYKFPLNVRNKHTFDIVSLNLSVVTVCFCQFLHFPSSCRYSNIFVHAYINRMLIFIKCDLIAYQVP